MKQMEVTHFPCASVSSAGVEKSNEILKIHNDKKQQQKHLTKSENKITDVNMKWRWKIQMTKDSLEDFFFFQLSVCGW